MHFGSDFDPLNLEIPIRAPTYLTALYFNEQNSTGSLWHPFETVVDELGRMHEQLSKI